MYEFGRGVAQDLAEAFRLYELSAQQGYAPAQYNLGGMLRSGLGAAQDFVRVASWYWKAAEQNHATAQFNLGVMYERGDGVSADLSLAIFGYHRALENGDESTRQALTDALKKMDRSLRSCSESAG